MVTSALGTLFSTGLIGAAEIGDLLERAPRLVRALTPVILLGERVGKVPCDGG
jgi:hypothetical protein